jgi:hypothetical protein
MTLYARGDLTCIAVSVQSGGCGETHSRPVIDGAPVKIWELTCAKCEHVLNGGDQPEVLEFSYKRDRQGHLITNSQGHAIQDGIKRVRPRDPHWSNDINDLPKTGTEVAAEIKEEEQRMKTQEERSKKAEDLRTFSALMNIPGADPRKLAENLGIDLSALGLDEDIPMRKPRARTPRASLGAY